MFTIGVLSARTGVNVETIRYYERIGLLPAPPRTASRRRIYGDDAVRRLAFVRHGRNLGFGIAAIRTLLALQDKPDTSCAEASQIAGRQLASIEARIAHLEVLKADLARMIGACANERVGDCRVIKALAQQSGDGCGKRDLASAAPWGYS